MDAHSNILKILQKKKKKKKKIFSEKKSDIFHISAQNIDCGYLLEPPRQDGYIEYPQYMFFLFFLLFFFQQNKKKKCIPL